MNPKQLALSLLKQTEKHAPEILAGFSFAGTVCGVILAVKATPKALKSIEELKEKHPEKANSTVEKVKATWKYYIPAGAAITFSGVCLLFSNAKYHKQTAALAMACSLSENALKEYRDKVVESIGDKKEQSLRDEIAQEKVNANPVVQRSIVQTSGGNVLCYDTLSGRYFKSDLETIRRAQNDFNRELLLDDRLCLNEWYDYLGLPNIDDSIGNALCWTSERGYLNLSFSGTLSDDGTPCIVLDYINSPPKYDK